jgi:hypothetical protein
MVAESIQMKWDTHETSRTFRNDLGGDLKDKINKSETKNKNIRELHRGINELKKYYRAWISIVKKEENGVLLADSHLILRRWKNY